MSIKRVFEQVLAELGRDPPKRATDAPRIALCPVPMASTSLVLERVGKDRIRIRQLFDDQCLSGIDETIEWGEGHAITLDNFFVKVMVE